VQRIGLVCSPALGDTILFEGALQDVRKRFPEVQLIHICMKQNLAAAELLDGVDRRVIVDVTQPGETIGRIRGEKLDVLLDFSAWQRIIAFYTLLSGARFTAGFRTAGQHRAAAYDLVIEHRCDRHELENFRALVQAVGISPGSDPRLRIPNVEVEPFLEAEDIVVFHLWAGTQAAIREWPESSWIRLASAISGPRTLFVITGAPGDKPRVDIFCKNARAQGVNVVPFIGSDRFISLSHLLKRARIVISVNTGVMHLAAVLGAPTISLNGPTDNRRWGPVGRWTEGVSAPGSGCGFLNLGFEFDGHPTDCMERITVGQVLTAVERLSKKASGGAGEKIATGSSR
jgi:ADP-heptose:LPS heptosyltransferase